jgi:hypothetical protein
MLVPGSQLFWHRQATHYVCRCLTAITIPPRIFSYCRHKQQDFGWWRLVSVSGGFVAHSADPAQLCLCVALRNNLPVPLPLLSASLTLSDAQGNWQQTLHVGPAPPATTTTSISSSKGTVQQPSAPAAAAAGDIAAGMSELQLTAQPQQQHLWPLQLQPSAWQQLHAVFEPRCIGAVVCEQLELRLTGQSSVLFRVQSFPPGRTALGGSTAGPEGPFGLQQQVKLGVWTAKVQHVGRLPQMQVRVTQDGWPRALHCRKQNGASCLD